MVKLIDSRSDTFLRGRRAAAGWYLARHCHKARRRAHHAPKMVEGRVSARRWYPAYYHVLISTFKESPSLPEGRILSDVWSIAERRKTMANGGDDGPWQGAARGISDVSRLLMAQRITR
jgi:hypothetical protein